MDVPYWEFTGNTVVTSNYVRLTPDRQSKSGSLWNTVVRTCLRVTHLIFADLYCTCMYM